MTKLQNLKKSINTIVKLFPALVVKFSLEDQKAINDFLHVISYFNEADNKRDVLLVRFRNYASDTRRNSRYFDNPFLGFTVIMSENAIYHLSIARFYPIEFYDSLLHQLRPLFQLIRTAEPLNSQKYDKISRKIKIMYSPLTLEELLFLRQTYAILNSYKIDSLTSNFIKTEIGKKEEISRQLKKETEISRFFTLIEGRWWIHFHSPAFGLNRVFVNFESKRDSIFKILNFNDPKNTVLCRSNVYQIPGSNKEFVGTLLIPSKDFDLLETFFRRHENRGTLNLKDLQLINCRRRSTSFKNYKEGVGWQKISRSKKNYLKNYFARSKPKEEFTQEEELQFNPPSNPEWEFTQEQNPEKIIELYCRTPVEYSYSNLPFNISIEKTSAGLSRKDIEKLRYFFTNKVIDTGFVPWRLIDDFSVEMYFIKTPLLSLSKLRQFLISIPYAEVYFTSKGYLIWTVLNPYEVKWIVNSFDWIIKPVQRIHVINKMNFSWFNSHILQWNIPEVLQEISEK